MATPHIHQAKINEWAADPDWPWQIKDDARGDWRTLNCAPCWSVICEYRRKPRWFDMEQEWVAKGKPPIEMLCIDLWREVSPQWNEDQEYRFKGVSRHAALKAEWEAKGRPERQLFAGGKWRDIAFYVNEWFEENNYRIKPTPHPDADVLRALAEDGSLDVYVLAPSAGHGDRWVSVHQIATRFSLKTKGISHD